MDEKEFDLLVGKVKDQTKSAIKTEVEEAVKGMLTVEQLSEKLEASGLSEKAMKELTDAVEKQGEEMKKLFEKKGEQKTFEQAIDEKAEDIKKLATASKGASLQFTLNQKAQVTRASVSNTTMAMRLPGVGELPYLGTVMSGLFRHAPVSPSSNGVIRYYDQATVTRGADMVAEGAVKPESAITWEERTLNLQKIADTIPVTKEAFNDVGFIKSELDRLLNINLALKEDQQLWDGTGVAPQLNGIYTQAPAFNAAGYSASGWFEPTDPSVYDLIAILRVQIMNTKESKYMPNYVIMNPVDILRYKLKKSSDNMYILPPFISADGTRIDGMVVIESSQVTMNTMLVGDFRYGTIYDLEDVTIEMGWVNDQFVRNAMTILAEKRMGLLVRNVDNDAFMKVDDITAALTAIAPGV